MTKLQLEVDELKHLCLDI